MRSTAEGNNGKDNNTDREEQRKLKRKGRCAEQNTAQHLAPDAPELLRPVQLQEQLHRNLIVHGHMISDVQNAICESVIPRSLNMTAETMFKTTNGKPIAKYKLGTQ